MVDETVITADEIGARTDEVNALTQKLLQGDTADSSPKPSIIQPNFSLNLLPGGLLDGETVLREIEVRELTGEHEERIAKARQGEGSMIRWLNAILESGLVSIGGKSATPELIGELLVGDRDYALLAISIATFGDEIELGERECANCHETYTVALEPDDVPLKRLASAKDRKFEVPLRKGGVAVVRLPNGHDQREVLGEPDLTDAERNSILLKRCVVMLPDGDGGLQSVAGFPSRVNGLGIQDRKKILDEISNRMPGPQYHEIELEHECGERIPVSLGLMSLFPGL